MSIPGRIIEVESQTTLDNCCQSGVICSEAKITLGHRTSTSATTLSQNFVFRRSSLQFYILSQVGWNYVDFTHKVVKFTKPKDKSVDDYRDLTLFRTKFVNSSDDKQRYTFRTERQTKSSCSLSVQKGYTLGASTNLEFALPTNAAPGVRL